MPKKFEIYRTKIMGGCQSGRKVVTHISKSDLPLLRWTLKAVSYLLDSMYVIKLFSFESVALASRAQGQ